MKYAHILAAFASEVWAMQPDKLHAIVEVIAFQVAGGKLSMEELEAKISDTRAKAVARQEGNVALLPLRGVIANRASIVGDVSTGGGTSAEAFGKMFQAALRDDAIKAIVLDVDTPGGAVSGASELSQMIFDARGQKPIIASVNANMGSAGYWIGSAADEIAVTRSGAVGSIGVYGVHKDITKALELQGIKETVISAGKFKTEGAGPLSDEALAAIQGRVDAAYDLFVKDVARNRGVTQQAVRDGFGQGRMVDAEPAVADGMADKIGTLEDTLQRLGASMYGAPIKSGRAGSGSRAFDKAAELRSLALAEEPTE